MIIKFLSRKSNSGQLIKYALRYILKDEKRQQPKPAEELINSKEALLIKHNIRSRTLKGFIREFDENEAFRLVRRRDSVKVFHTIISFGANDRELVTDKILKNVTKKYISERGPNCLYLGTKHEDKGHIHLHIVSSGTQLNGRSARISNQKFRSIKLTMDRYQRDNYPFLVHSLPDYLNEKRLSKEALVTKLKTSRQTTKATLLETLEKVFAESKSQEEFIGRIRSMGHEPYTRNGRLQGLLFQGKTKFRFSRLGFSQERLEGLDLPLMTHSRTQHPELMPGQDQEPPEKLKAEIKENTVYSKADGVELETLRAIRSRNQERAIDQELERTWEDEGENRSDERTADDSETLFLPSPIHLLPLPLKKEA